MRILVTGGAGFIGSHTCVALHEAGMEPVILDNFSNAAPDILDGLARIIGYKPLCYTGDCLDTALVANLLQMEKIQGVIHFAAYKAVGESVQEPLKYYENNVGGLISVLKAMQKTGCETLVFSSSCTVYGQPDLVPVSENTPRLPAQSPYGNTKAIGEDVLRDVVQAGVGLKTIALRYFNPIGAHPSAEIGELPIGIPANLVPFITQSVAGLRPPVTVFGTDYLTPDGTGIRDYIHVMDLAEAHVQALRYLSGCTSPYYDEVNVGTGTGNSVLEIIRTFEAVNGIKVPHVLGKRRAGDVVQIYAEVHKAASMLQWQTRRSLADALQDAWRWQQRLSARPLG